MNINRIRLIALTLTILLAVSLSGCTIKQGSNSVIINTAKADDIVTGVDVTDPATGEPAELTTNEATLPTAENEAT